MRIEHDIFRTPHAVDLTIEERPTPPAYARFLPAGTTMPMWRVQTEGYTEGTDQLIGLVSRDAGFLDSPDTEWISSGVNSKSPEAVAIGRHGNFFLWGFAASPTYLTAEAKLVFINAVHYIARFDRQAPIARKRPGTTMRKSALDALERISDDGYAQALASHAEFVKAIEQRNAAVRARIAAGEEVPDRDRRMLDQPAPRPPQRFEAAKRYVAPDVWPKIDSDEQAIAAHIRRNLPYMRSSGWYELVVDDELKQFGVANNDMALLDRAIAALQDGQKAEVARTLLERYTDESFAMAAEWSAWLETNRESLFFTEAGGYKWLVNSRVNRSTKPASDSAAPPAAKTDDLHPTPDNPLAARLRVVRLGDGRLDLRVDVKILEGWHAYDHVAGGSPYVPLTVELELPAGLKRSGNWTRPRGHAYPHDASVTVFENEFAFRCELQGKAPETPDLIACTLSYQVCDEQMCMPPTTEKLTAEFVTAEK